MLRRGGRERGASCRAFGAQHVQITGDADRVQARTLRPAPTLAPVPSKPPGQGSRRPRGTPPAPTSGDCPRAASAVPRRPPAASGSSKPTAGFAGTARSRSTVPSRSITCCRWLNTLGCKRRREGGDFHRSAKVRRVRVSRSDGTPRLISPVAALSSKTIGALVEPRPGSSPPNSTASQTTA